MIGPAMKGRAVGRLPFSIQIISQCLPHECPTVVSVVSCREGRDVAPLTSCKSARRSRCGKGAVHRQNSIGTPISHDGRFIGEMAWRFSIIWAFALTVVDFVAVAQRRDRRYVNRLVCARAEAMLRGDDPDGVPDVVKQAAWVEGEGGGL